MAYMPSISDTVIFLKIIDVTLLGILVIYSRLVTLSVERLMKQLRWPHKFHTFMYTVSQVRSAYRLSDDVFELVSHRVHHVHLLLCDLQLILGQQTIRLLQHQQLRK